MDETTTLYRFFDKDERLLYVGITNSMPRRAHQHSKKAQWHHHASLVTLEHFSSRQEALNAEAKAIKEEKPFYNIAGSDGQLENPVDHLYRLHFGEIEDPIHETLSKEMVRILQTCNTSSNFSDKVMWAFLNAHINFWNEVLIPCIPCRNLANDDYILAGHYRVCKDYENESRGVK